MKTWESQSVRTDSSGRWAISITPDAIPDDYLPESRDYLNFELRIWDGARLASWSATGWWLKGARVWRTDEAAGTADAVMAVGVDLESEQITVTDSFGETERSPLPVARPEGP